MKKIITACIFCFLCGECFSQAGEWVWIKGDSIPNQPANYGVQGVPGPTNNPPGLYEACEWTDLNGNFWLFGGTNNGEQADLWRYNHITNEWTWMKGSGIANDPGNYGIMGVSSPANLPPARGWGIASWVDGQGNLWMFGGQGPYDLSDLWKYEIATNEWTWMKGPNIPNQSGVYGTMGVPNVLNNPGSRHETAAAWTDSFGDLWFFGGLGFNDLWRFNIASNEWTWMKGDSVMNTPGVYGTLGIEAPSNKPGSRWVYSHWKDNTGNFWLYGGTGANHFNDIWRYNPVSNNWAWMGGDSTGNPTAVYGIKCSISTVNDPGSRWENRASWKDSHGNFWFLGGFTGTAILNDLWIYCVSTDKWSWISGDAISNPVGFWGSIGTSSPFNKPNGRCGTLGWTANNTDFYLYGGLSYNVTGTYNDLWKYTIDSTCGICPNTTGIQENNFTNELLVYPNPTNSSFTISFSSSEKQTIELRIYNTLGKQIYVDKEEITKGKFVRGDSFGEKEINVEKWSDGIYFLQVKMKEGVLSKKVVVQH